jgi:hypothetical protein
MKMFRAAALYLLFLFILDEFIQVESAPTRRRRQYNWNTAYQANSISTAHEIYPWYAEAPSSLGDSDAVHQGYGIGSPGNALMIMCGGCTNR